MARRSILQGEGLGIVEDESMNLDTTHCPKCKLLLELYEGTPKSPRQYWVMTELFVLLHGSDVCDWKQQGEVDVMSAEFKVVTTYGGVLGRLARRLGCRWNHILLVLWVEGAPAFTYESNWRGVNGHPFQEGPDLAQEHTWWVPKKPLTVLETAHLLGYCEGAMGRWYAPHYWLAIAWRILKDFLLGPTSWQAAAAIPVETCVSFVDSACRSVGCPVSSFGAGGLPDDIAQSPYWRLDET